MAGVFARLGLIVLGILRKKVLQIWSEIDCKRAVLRIRNDLFRIRIQLSIFRVPDPDPDPDPTHII